MAARNSTSADETITVNIVQLIMPAAIVLSTLIFSTSFLLGMNNLSNAIEEGGLGGNTNTAGSGDTDSVVPPAAADTTGKTDIDDDPMIGDDDAKVVLVEFSDFECPFCQRHHQQTHDQIIEEFVDTGKIKYVYRDYPLSFHDPVATREANGAQCLYELSGKNDEKFFEFTAEIYERTGANGQAIDNVGIDGVNAKLIEMAGNYGIDKGKFQDCLEAEKYTEEIQADMAEGSSAGVTGTPGFIIGVLGDDGSVDGVRISGAQPFSVFKSAIEEQLEKAD